MDVEKLFLQKIVRLRVRHRFQTKQLHTNEEPCAQCSRILEQHLANTQDPDHNGVPLMLFGCRSPLKARLKTDITNVTRIMTCLECEFRNTSCNLAGTTVAAFVPGNAPPNTIMKDGYETDSVHEGSVNEEVVSAVSENDGRKETKIKEREWT